MYLSVPISYGKQTRSIVNTRNSFSTCPSNPPGGMREGRMKKEENDLRNYPRNSRT
jgi:hypothetical protein